MTINFLDLKKQYSTLDIQDIMGNIEEVIRSASFVGGKHLDDFEKNFGLFNGSPHTVGVGSGTDALILSLLALGIGKGDEVIVPANTFIATALAVTHVGATPVFVDVCPISYLIDIDKLEEVVTTKTAAIIPVHLYGNAVYMPDIIKFADKHSLYVIEDCAQAIGARVNGKRVGTWGDVGCFSFYPAKNLGGLGQGGAVLTSDTTLANKIRSLGNVGRKEDSWYVYDKVGYNSRLDSINALFLGMCLEKVEHWNTLRKEVAKLYYNKLRALTWLKLPTMVKGGDHVYHLYELCFRDLDTRDAVQQYLQSKGISSALHYPIPCHKQEIYTQIETVDLPITERLANTLLSVPMHPFMEEKEIEQVCSAIVDYK